MIRIPAVTETNEDVIENAYHLVIADFERAKPLLYKKEDPVICSKAFLIPFMGGMIRCRILD